jgi:hypothetical protein
MAANRATLNNYLTNTIGIAYQAIIGALKNQGLDSFDNFLLLTETDVANVCTKFWKPGGTIPNPAFNTANPAVNVPATLPNPGYQLGHVYEKQLKLL